MNDEFHVKVAGRLFNVGACDVVPIERSVIRYSEVKKYFKAHYTAQNVRK